MDFFSDIFLVCACRTALQIIHHSFSLGSTTCGGKTGRAFEGTNVEERVWWVGRGRGGEDTNVEERICVCRVSCRVEVCGMVVRGEGVQG